MIRFAISATTSSRNRGTLGDFKLVIIMIFCFTLGQLPHPLWPPSADSSTPTTNYWVVLLCLLCLLTYGNSSPLLLFRVLCFILLQPSLQRPLPHCSGYKLHLVDYLLKYYLLQNNLTQKTRNITLPRQCLHTKHFLHLASSTWVNGFNSLLGLRY